MRGLSSAHGTLSRPGVARLSFRNDHATIRAVLVSAKVCGFLVRGELQLYELDERCSVGCFPDSPARAAAREEPPRHLTYVRHRLRSDDDAESRVDHLHADVEDLS